MHILIGYLVVGLVGSVLSWWFHDPAVSDLFLDLVFIWGCIAVSVCISLMACFVASQLKSITPFRYGDPE